MRGRGWNDLVTWPGRSGGQRRGCWARIFGGVSDHDFIVVARMRNDSGARRGVHVYALQSWRCMPAVARGVDRAAFRQSKGRLGCAVGYGDDDVCSLLTKLERREESPPPMTTIFRFNN